MPRIAIIALLMAACGEKDPTCAPVYQETQVGLAADPAEAAAGYEHCWTESSSGEGWADRTEALACATEAGGDSAECAADADCGSTIACACAAGFSFDEGGGYHSFLTAGTCLPADCRTGADCPSGECGVAWDCCGQGGAAVGLYCRSDADACRSSEDCGGGSVCTWSSGRFECVGSCECD